MRTLPATSIGTQYGTEVVTYVVLETPNGPVTYYSKPNYDNPVIISISDLENVVSLDGSSSSTNITVTVSDSNNHARNLINYQNIHKYRAKVYIWEPRDQFSQSILLFDGQVNTPIVWDESKRQVTFTIVSIVETGEFGFSADEGFSNYLPTNISGEAWPIIYGTVPRVPAIQLNESPSVLLGYGFARLDHAQWEAEKAKLLANYQECHQKSADAYGLGVSMQYAKMAFQDGLPDPEDNEDTARQYDEASASYYQQSGEFALQAQQYMLQFNLKVAEYNYKKTFEYPMIMVLSPDVWRGPQWVVEISGSRFYAAFAGNVMLLGAEIPTITRKQKPAFLSSINRYSTQTTYNYTSEKPKLKWFNGGERVTLVNYPIHYILGLGLCQIGSLYAKYKGMTIKIPQNLYFIEFRPFTSVDGRQVVATVAIFPQALNTLLDVDGNKIWDGDDIWADITGPIPGKFCDIMLNVLSYSNLAYDPVSWGLVRTYTDHIPMNFVIYRRDSCLTIMKELAFQAKCAIWLKGATVFMRYLPATPNPVKTFTLDDVLEDTMQTYCSPTEDIITKLVALWKYRYIQYKNNRTTMRNNIARYGMTLNEIDYYAFSDLEAVKWSLRYWIIRYSNSWKLVSFRTHLGNIALEAFDAVIIDFAGFVANEPVIGIVKQAVYSPGESDIFLEVWLPVRFGEMNTYKWAYPADSTQLFPDIGEAYTGNPFEGVEDTTGFLNYTAIPFMGVQMGRRNPKYEPVYPDQYIPDYQVSTSINIGEINYTNPIDLDTSNDYQEAEIKELTGYQFTETGSEGNTGDFVEIMSHDGGYTYTGQLWSTGKYVTVYQMQINEDDVIPNGTFTQVVKVNGEYLMQVPIFLPEPE